MKNKNILFLYKIETISFFIGVLPIGDLQTWLARACTDIGKRGFAFPFGLFRLHQGNLSVTIADKPRHDCYVGSYDKEYCKYPTQADNVILHWSQSVVAFAITSSDTELSCLLRLSSVL
jgi:hypothetical protein